ncbi:hypothetical protein JXB28_01125 [Candidatus Woesearchaeota archaeon]|nr:hypothetical protein [Candidatus Woesearchaeota archaeon]
MRDRFAFSISILVVVALTAIIGMIGVFGAAGGSDFQEQLSGNGFIFQAVSVTDGDRIKEITTAKVSFGGKLGFGKDNEPAGNWHVKFFDVGNNELDGSQFRSAKIISLRFDDACGKSAHFSALGKLDNELGWNLLVDASAADPVSGHEANIRVRLSHPVYGEVYDSASEFTSVDYCIGQTLVDSGNLNFR